MAFVQIRTTELRLAEHSGNEGKEWAQLYNTIRNAEQLRTLTLCITAPEGLDSKDKMTFEILERIRAAKSRKRKRADGTRPEKTPSSTKILLRYNFPNNQRLFDICFYRTTFSIEVFEYSREPRVLRNSFRFSLKQGNTNVEASKDLLNFAIERFSVS